MDSANIYHGEQGRIIYKIYFKISRLFIFELFALAVISALFLLLLLGCAGAKQVEVPLEIWNKTIGGDYLDIGYGAAIDSDNNIIVTGATDSFGSGYSDAWTLKYDPDGNLLWKRTAGDIYNDRGHDVAVDSENNIIVTGTTGSEETNFDFFTIKYDPEGSVIWKKFAGGSEGDIGFGTAVDSKDNIIVTGFTSSYGAGGEDVWTIKYSPHGDVLWNRTEGGIYNDSAMAVAIDTDDNIIVAGVISSFDDGGSDFDCWIIKYDAGGNMIWNTTSGGDERDECYTVSVDAKGNIIVSGATKSFRGIYYYDSALWTIKYDGVGNMIWNRTTGGSNFDGGFGIAADRDNNIIAAGYTGSFGLGYTDLWLIKYDPWGNIVWNRTEGSYFADYGFDVAIDRDNNIIAVGGLSSYEDEADVWIIKYKTRIKQVTEVWGGDGKNDAGDGITGEGSKDSTYKKGEDKSIYMNFIIIGALVLLLIVLFFIGTRKRSN